MDEKSVESVEQLECELKDEELEQTAVGGLSAKFNKDNKAWRRKDEFQSVRF